VKDNTTKIRLICDRAQAAFKLEKRLLIVVPNFQAAEYVDTLLWKMPSESFLPHTIVDTSTIEWIAITMQENFNVNQAVHLLNLSPAPSALTQQVEEIFELFDETSPEKTKLSQEKLKGYQSMGLTVDLH